MLKPAETMHKLEFYDLFNWDY